MAHYECNVRPDRAVWEDLPKLAYPDRFVRLDRPGPPAAGQVARCTRMPGASRATLIRSTIGGYDRCAPARRPRVHRTAPSTVQVQPCPSADVGRGAGGSSSTTTTGLPSVGASHWMVSVNVSVGPDRPRPNWSGACRVAIAIGDGMRAHVRHPRRRQRARGVPVGGHASGRVHAHVRGGVVEQHVPLGHLEPGEPRVGVHPDTDVEERRGHPFGAQEREQDDERHGGRRILTRTAPRDVDETAA
jgi:hypothetical protein